MTNTDCDCGSNHDPAATSDPDFREQLFNAELLFDTGVDGLYGRSGTYMSIRNAVDRIVSDRGRELGVTEISFPPLMARPVFRKSGYLESFPDLIGSVHVFRGGEREHREMLDRTYNDGDWQQMLEPADVVLCSAVCHPVYPLCTGVLPEGGRMFDIGGYCFRHEPSKDPARMLAFQQHDLVYVGTPDGAREHRDRSLEWALEVLKELGLDADAVPANDPFFGRGGRLLAADQRSEALKIEAVATVSSEERPTAIVSANCHQDHFGRDFDIQTPDGEVAHSACIGFGADRITLALLRAHGFDPEQWPASVKARLWS